jgi:hypothetical protein
MLLPSAYKAIRVVDDVFTPDECAELIRYYVDRPDSVIRRIGAERPDFVPIVSHEDHFPRDAFVADRLRRIIGHAGADVRPQRAHLEYRQDMGCMPLHKDRTNPTTVFTSVTYLNDDYAGGETLIRPLDDEPGEDVIVRPQVGRTVFYDGLHRAHAVQPISKAENGRWTLPVWYMLYPADLPAKHKWWLA